jgi:hypothetical protein
MPTAIGPIGRPHGAQASTPAIKHCLKATVHAADRLDDWIRDMWLSTHFAIARPNFVPISCSRREGTRHLLRSRTYRHRVLSANRGRIADLKIGQSLFAVEALGCRQSGTASRRSTTLPRCPSPAVSPRFASSIALRTSGTSSPLSSASATTVVLFLEPGLRPPLPFSKGRPRTRECGCGLGCGGRFCPGVSRLIRAHPKRRPGG